MVKFLCIMFDLKKYISTNLHHIVKEYYQGKKI